MTSGRKEVVNARVDVCTWLSFLISSVFVGRFVSRQAGIKTSTRDRVRVTQGAVCAMMNTFWQSQERLIADVWRRKMSWIGMTQIGVCRPDKRFQA